MSTVRWPPARYLGDRLRALGIRSDDLRVERVLAVSRAMLAVASLIAVYVDPVEPAEYAALAFALIVFFNIYSFSLLALLRFAMRRPRLVQYTVHTLDFAWPLALTLISSGPNSPFFPFFLLVLFSAAYRWGFRATVFSGAVCSAVLMLETLIFIHLPKLVEGEFEMNRFIIRATYLLVMGFLLGYLAEDEKRLRGEAAAAAQIMGRMRANHSLRENLETVFEQLFVLFGAERGLLVVDEQSSERMFVWDAAERRSNVALHLSEIEPASQPKYRFLGAGETWYAAAAENPGVLEVDALGPGGSVARRMETEVAAPFLNSHPLRSMLAARFLAAAEWSATIVLFDPVLGASPKTTLHFLDALVRQAGPSAYNVYLLRKFKARAGAVERARMARELHDGVLQSLIALEMQLDVIRREPAAANGLGVELLRMQRVVHDEVATVRELMQQMKPVELQSGQFLDYMAEIVQRFQRDTGIQATFLTDLDEAAVPQRTARELIRILQEALVNVRKHSGARNVLVRFGARLGRWLLTVEDDGRGFDFSGRLQHRELDDAGKGPAIIKERLRGLNGHLMIESTPGHGARLEISLPQKAYG